MPLPIAFVLYAAIAARYDLEPQGPTYVEQEMIAALDRLEAEHNPKMGKDQFRSQKSEKKTKRKRRSI